MRGAGYPIPALAPGTRERSALVLAVLAVLAGVAATANRPATPTVKAPRCG
ncbi:hypothetical protein [Streptosporangium sp. V21-05]|uniref:hypothetical protein n=1 Tax=Streptosporangium sp. V21-05 TaxID=3446115 RepID=UPI003F52D5F4